MGDRWLTYIQLSQQIKCGKDPNHNVAVNSITAAAIAFGAGYIEEDQSAAMDFGKGNCSGGHIPSVCGH